MPENLGASDVSLSLRLKAREPGVPNKENVSGWARKNI